MVYKLFGVVVHAGGAAWSGHYYAFVRRGENWFKVVFVGCRWMIVMCRKSVRRALWGRMLICCFIKRYFLGYEGVRG